MRRPEGEDPRIQSRATRPPVVAPNDDVPADLQVFDGFDLSKAVAEANHATCLAALQADGGPAAPWPGQDKFNLVGGPKLNLSSRPQDAGVKLVRFDGTAELDLTI